VKVIERPISEDFASTVLSLHVALTALRLHYHNFRTVLVKTMEKQAKKGKPIFLRN